MKMIKALSLVKSINKLNNIKDSKVVDAETIKIKNRNGYDYDVKVSDYCVVKFPFVCMAKSKEEKTDRYYPVKIEGWYSSGRRLSGELVTTIKDLYEYSGAVWYGTTSSEEFKKAHYGEAFFTCHPTEIKDLNSHWRKATKEEVKRYYQNRGYTVLDSTHDSKVVDSPASEIVNEIKRTYPQVQIRQFAGSSSFPGYHRTRLMFKNYPGEGATGFGNDPRTAERDKWEKYLAYLYKKYVGKFSSTLETPVAEYLDIYDKTHDSTHDVDASRFEIVRTGYGYDVVDKKTREHLTKASSYKEAKEDLTYVLAHPEELNDSCHDELDDADIDDLIAEEYEAIADYEAALTQCENATVKERLTHILEEEKEHVRELEELKAKQEPITDGVSPQTYIKLKAKGYTHKDWEKWSDEEKVKKSQEGGEGSKEKSSKKEEEPEDDMFDKLEKIDKDVKEKTGLDIETTDYNDEGYRRVVVRNTDIPLDAIAEKLGVPRKDIHGINLSKKDGFWQIDTHLERVKEGSPLHGSKEEQNKYDIGTKFSIKNPFIHSIDKYEVVRVSPDYIAIKGPGDVIQRLSKEEFEEQFFNKRLKEKSEEGKETSSKKKTSQERINEPVYKMKAPEIKSTLAQHEDDFNTVYQISRDYDKLRDKILSMPDEEYHQKKVELGSKLQDVFTKVMNDFDIKTEPSKNSQGFASTADKENTEQLKLLLKEAGVKTDAMSDVLFEQEDGSSMIFISSLIPLLHSTLKTK